MPGNITWRSGSQNFPIQLSGAGREIANGVNYLCSGILYNDGRSGILGFVGTAELVTAASGFAAAVTNDVSIDLFLVPSLDGTNFGTASVSGLPATALKGQFVTPVSGNVSRLRMEVEGIPLMPYAYQVWLQNNTGGTLTSGWSLNIDVREQAYT
jgi:hypothetical protein